MVRLEIEPGQCSSLATVETPIQAQRRVPGWHATLPILWTGPWCLQAPRVHGTGKQLGTIRPRDQGSNPGGDRDFLFGTASRPALESTQPYPDTFPRGKAARVWNWLHTSLYRPRQHPTAPRGSGSQDFHISGTGRWQGCQPYALAALKPVCISVRGWVNPKATVQPEGLNQWKISNIPSRDRTRNLPACNSCIFILWRSCVQVKGQLQLRLSSMKYRIFILWRCVKPRSRLAFTRHNVKTPH
jgi:hypothetical protein